MSCPWIDNREKKEAEKMEKYGPLRFELIKRYPNYKIVQLGWLVEGTWSADEQDLRFTYTWHFEEDAKGGTVELLNIARTFKVITKWTWSRTDDTYARVNLFI